MEFHITGFIIENYYLISGFHVPQQLIDKFNQLTSLIMENGWLQFIDLQEKFWFKLTGIAESIGQRHQLEFEPITLDEFYYPLIVLFCHLTIVTMIFIGEIIRFRVQNLWRRALVYIVPL